MHASVSLSFFFILLQYLLSFTSVSASPSSSFRPPAVPLIVHDSFVSIWQGSDNLTDTFASFWSNPTIGMVGILKVNNLNCRFMGIDTYTPSGNTVACPQQGLPIVTATQTYYTFLHSSFPTVQLNVTFTTPVLANDINTWMDNPVTYITLTVTNTDSTVSYTVQSYFAATAELAVDDVTDSIQWGRDIPSPVNGAQLLRVGTQSQNVLGVAGDGRRISWGYLYLAVPDSSSSVNVATTIANNTVVGPAFLNGNTLPPFDTNYPRACSDGWPMLTATWDYGTLAPSIALSSFFVFTYDEIANMKYYGEPLYPSWKHNGTRTIIDVITTAIANYTAMINACLNFDTTLTNEFITAGGSRYAEMANLVHRQVYGAMIYTSVPTNLSSTCLPPPPNGFPNYWTFMEEMSSDGDVSTIDVLYPASPGVLYFQPELMYNLMVPVMAYAANCTSAGSYQKPFAPHDLGTWPIANRAWNNQEDMPLEESANMLILSGVAYNMTGTTNFIAPYQWTLLDNWAQFVNQSLPTPPAQLATDDFLGPAPNNTNLVVKGLTGLNAYAGLLDAIGRSTEANQYRTWASNYVNFYLTNAYDNVNGTRYKREYQLPNGSTYSLKYNSIYGYYLEFFDTPSWFPSSMMITELDYYANYQNYPCGVPLDDRNIFALVEYMGDLLGVAGAIAINNGGNSTYQTILTDQLYTFTTTTLPRVPMTDWYRADNGKQWGFQARATVGDLYALALIKNRRFGG